MPCFTCHLTWVKEAIANTYLGKGCCKFLCHPDLCQLWKCHTGETCLKNGVLKGQVFKGSFYFLHLRCSANSWTAWLSAFLCPKYGLLPVCFGMQNLVTDYVWLNPWGPWWELFNTAPGTVDRFGSTNVKRDLLVWNLKPSQVGWKERRKGFKNQQQFTLFYTMGLLLPFPSPLSLLLWPQKSEQKGVFLL